MVNQSNKFKHVAKSNDGYCKIGNNIFETGQELGNKNYHIVESKIAHPFKEHL